MPRVIHVKAARKDNPVTSKGGSYYWWKFRYGGKRYSLTYPRSSQLTQSAYYGAVRSLSEMIEDAGTPEDNDALTTLRDEAVSEIENIGEECSSSLENMPESLTYSPTGELLQERIDACEEARGELENIEEFDEDEPEEGDFTPDKMECDGCEGTGFEDTEHTVECTDCRGEGEVDDDDSAHGEFEEAHQTWASDMSEHMDTAFNELLEHISSCEV